VNSARLILISLICAVPTILLVDGPIIRGLVAATLSGGIAVVAGTMRQGETEFLLSLIRPVIAVAIIPVLWMLLQVMPLKTGLAHPIWQSAEQALGYPISGSISVDPGSTLLSLGQYLSALAVFLLAAAVAVDRERAEWVLFALVGATALVAIVMIGHDLMSLDFLNGTAGAQGRAQAQACIALGVIVSVAGVIRTFERYETGHLRPGRSSTALNRTLAACGVALALCVIALALDLTIRLLVSVAYGLGTLLAVVAVRRSGLGSWGCMAIATTAGVIAIVLVVSQPPLHATDLTLAFAADTSGTLVSAAQHIMADAPWMGTGAGTFNSLLPIYQDAGDMKDDPIAPTVAAKIAIELGRPMLWAVILVVLAGIIVLLRGALRRGRDSFYPAAGAGSLVLLLFLSFCDSGVLGTPVAVCAAAIVGLAFAQCESRTIV
jgi:hypothetical protein